jgi:hypothetical protein
MEPSFIFINYVWYGVDTTMTQKFWMLAVIKSCALGTNEQTKFSWYFCIIGMWFSVVQVRKKTKQFIVIIIIIIIIINFVNCVCNNLRVSIY